MMARISGGNGLVKGVYRASAQKRSSSDMKEEIVGSLTGIGLPLPISIPSFMVCSKNVLIVHDSAEMYRVRMSIGEKEEGKIRGDVV